MSAIFPPVLNISEFESYYPDCIQLTNGQLNMLWIKVARITPSLVWDMSQQTAQFFWYSVLAHLCYLSISKQSGRLIGATQGNTSSTFENLGTDMSGSLQWWYQTSAGAEIAQLMKQQGGITYVS